MPRGTESASLGATPAKDSVRFSVWSGAAERVWVSLFGHGGEAETDRVELTAEGDGIFAGTVTGAGAGIRYGFRADGPWAPADGHWFDPQKLLTDPYAIAIDRPYIFDARLAAPRDQGIDTASLMPKSIVTALPQAVPRSAPLFTSGGLIYEIPVRGFTMLHPDVPPEIRGTIAALAHPAIVEHLLKLGVSAVELMPVTAWIDERHLPVLGLANAWGYNPVSFMALDPRLAPGGLAELRSTVATLRAAGIGVILDLVFNHTGESDSLGATLSLRGLDNRAYFRHAQDPAGLLVNDTGTGNTIACDHPVVGELVLDTLRHFVLNAGVDGYRFDLAPVLGRTADGFDRNASLLNSMREDPLLADRVLIAEPWDIGPNGYQLGQFPSPFLEWNDRYRDDVRRFWRGDRGMIGDLATRLAGSADIFASDNSTRTVNFIAAHDGFTLADLAAFERKHNEENGEQNRDGHNENLSWNNGAEGPSTDAVILTQRRRDIHAMLSTLFFSRGTIMLTAGDELGRTQHGNNNAYAQDNNAFWLNWAERDEEIEAFAATLSAIRQKFAVLRDCALLTGRPVDGAEFPDVAWLRETGTPLGDTDWHDPERQRLTMLLTENDARLALIVNGDRRASVFSLPERYGFRWSAIMPAGTDDRDPTLLPGRSCACFVETRQ